MRLFSVAAFTDQPSEVQVCRSHPNAQFFLCFAAGGRVRRFAGSRIELSAARTPEPTIGLLRPFEKEHAVLLVEAVEERRDVVRQGRHNYFAKALKAASASLARSSEFSARGSLPMRKRYFNVSGSPLTSAFLKK